MTPSEAPIDVFICYKREERDVAKALAEVLARRGYSLWWDVELLPGDRFVDSIMAVINRAKAVVVLWSRHAVASDFVRAEARAAHAQGKLIPVRLDDCDLPLPFNDLHTLDLTTWWPDADDAKLEPLLRSLEVRIGKPRSPPQPPEATEANLHSQDHQADFWRSISERQPQSAQEYELYLRKYPNGHFVDLARLRLQDLRQSRPGKTAAKAIVTTKNALIALGAVAAAGTAVITFGDQIRERCESWGWCAEPNGENGQLPPLPDLPLPETTRIPPGNEPLTFTMGSTTGPPRERPLRNVTLAQPFHMSKTPVTFEQYAAFAREDGRAPREPSDFGWDEAETTLPVVGVSWHDARDYADWLGETARTTCRLPSEAEWEYACRAGKETEYWWGNEFDESKANTREGGSGRPSPVGDYPKSPWNLYDMSGNVWEWVEDHWHENYDGAPSDGSAWIDDDAPETGPRVLRGGSWGFNLVVARCAFRSESDPYDRDFDFGFRVVCSSPITNR